MTTTPTARPATARPAAARPAAARPAAARPAAARPGPGRAASPVGPRPLDARFAVPIRKDGTFPTYLELPTSHDLLGTRRAVKVSGTLDGHPFSACLMPSGSGPHWLPLRAALCAAIGKRDAGQEVDVHLQQRLT